VKQMCDGQTNVGGVVLVKQMCDGQTNVGGVVLVKQMCDGQTNANEIYPKFCVSCTITPYPLHFYKR
jgi:hypothetical protein